MHRLRRKLLVAGFGLGIAALPGLRANAHGGGMDAKGCHTNRKTGEHHCHSSSNSKSGARLSPSAEQIFSAQTALTALGYDVGDVDGQPGSKTQAALEAFERSKDWPIVGEVNDAAIYRLVVVLSEKGVC